MKIYYRIICIMLLFNCSRDLIAQQDDLLDRMGAKDSIRSQRSKNLYDKTLVTREIRNLFFRNIYAARNGTNEDEEFRREISRLQSWEHKVIDTIEYIQINALGEYVYDTHIKSTRLERFLSTKLHKNTSLKRIENRYMLLKKGETFSAYKAYENARLIRSSNIFHDVRISGDVLESDTNRVRLTLILQDEFPYGFSYSPRSISSFDFGIENQNIAGTTHNFSTRFRVIPESKNQSFGSKIQYSIPNIIHKSFIDGYAFYQNFPQHTQYEVGIRREFVRQEIRWAGGLIASYTDMELMAISGSSVLNRVFRTESWLSRAFPIETKNATIHAIILGLKHSWNNHTDRPSVSPTSNFYFWKSHFILSSLGYSKIRYTQDRLLNGFGRTEDIPFGISVRGLWGIDKSEFGDRYYYGAQILNQYYIRSGSYVNFGVKLGFFSHSTIQSQGVFDFHLQRVSKSYKLGRLRLRHYLNIRTTIGLNQDSTSFLTLNEYSGIRGLNNHEFRGTQRYTISSLHNMFLPVSIGGFRVSIFGLLEAAKIDYAGFNFFNSPLRVGATIGLALKNENLIFDVLQFQYGFYPSTQSLVGRGFSITSILPFPFQNLDISKPTIVDYN